jgi:hypothetical protein
MTRQIADHATIDQLAAGYTSSERSHECLFCDHAVREGHVYRVGEDHVVAELAMQKHVADVHGSSFAALLQLGKKGTGLTETQRNLLGYFGAGLSDREIQPLVGGVSLSTIRNHRFSLREKARQARVFLALMELMERAEPTSGPRFIAIPGRKAADDERFAITESEFAQIVRKHFPDGPDGRLVRFPRKEKRKIAVMVQIVKRFDAGRRYTEAEVDAILDTATDDHTTLRRFLVDYGFLGRTRDGSEYWVE